MQNILALVVSNALLYATPLIFTALGGVFSERSGIVNVGLEGIMVIGAFSSVVFNLTFAGQFGDLTPWLALLVGGLCGLLFALIHAVATVNLRADHIISGTVLNLIAPSLAIFLTKVLFLAKTSILAYVGIVLAFVVWYLVFKTRFGLRLRSVGENPQAADTLGINVYLMRYAGVLLSGLLGGIGGAAYTHTISENFAVSTIAGQGFMAMAAMIFGKWNPIGAMLAAIFFGLAQSLAVIGASIPVIRDIPSVYLQIAPYVITIIVLIGFVGRSKAPEAVGTTYIKSK